MTILSSSRHFMSAALVIGGLGFAGSMAAPTTASAEADAKTCQGAFARNKTKIEQLAAKPGSEGAIARIMASAGCPGTKVSINRASAGGGQGNQRIRISCHMTWDPATIHCKWSIL